MDVGHYPHLTIEGYPIVGDGPLYQGKQPVLFLAAFPYLYLPNGKADISGQMKLNATWHESEDHAFIADYAYFRAYYGRNQQRTINQREADQGWALEWKNPTKRDFFVFVEVRNREHFALAQGQMTSPIFNITAVGVDPHPDPEHYSGEPDGDDIPAIYYTGEWVAGASAISDEIKVSSRLCVSELNSSQDGRFQLRLHWKRWLPDVTNPQQELRIQKLVHHVWIDVSQASFQEDVVEITDRDFTAYAIAHVPS